MKMLGTITILGKSFEAKVTLQNSRLQALKWSRRDTILDIVAFTPQERIEDKLFKSHYKNNAPIRVFVSIFSPFLIASIR